jgi:peptide/nickel transport system substrate-binding protein
MLKLNRKLLPALALVVMAGAHCAASAAEQVFVGAFDVGPGGNPQKFNPLTASAGFGFYNKYFSTLTLYDVAMQKIEGDLAESWSYSKDGKQLTIKLRKGVKWHDGHAFTAADVKFSLELIKDPEMASVFSVRLNDVVAIKAPDEHTVVLELVNPDITLPDAFTSIMMVPQHLLAKFTAKELRNSDWWKTPVGTGPFKWAKYLPDQYVELTANADFYRGKPKLDKLVNRYFKDISSAATALQTGEIQLTYLTADQVKDNQASKLFNTIAAPSQVLNYLGVNNSDPRFKDVRIREAILLAIDRSSIIKNIYGSQAQIANCVLTLPQYVPDNINPYTTNINKSKQLLADAGWSKINKGEPIELLTYYNDQVSKDVVATLQSMLAAVGVNIKPRFVDAPTYGQIVDAGKFSMVFAGAGNGPDPSALMPHLQSVSAPPKGINRMRVNLPELDQQFDTMQAQINTTARIGTYREICRTSNAQLPWLPLWVSNRFGGVSKNAQNVIWTPSPGGGRYQDFAEKWTVR